MQFVNVKAVFIQSFKVGDKTITQEIAIIRRPSGAFKYGDRSATDLELNGEWYESFDTRYERICPQKDKFIKDWGEYLRSRWGHNADYTQALKSFESWTTEEAD